MVSDICYLCKCKKLEVRLGERLCNFLTVYFSPSQSQDKFEKFCQNLQFKLKFSSPKIPFLTILIGNIKAKSSNLCINDKTT